MPAVNAQTAFRQEMQRFRQAHTRGDTASSLYHLERAHIVGQRFFWPHLITHLWMLRFALRQTDVRETIGQLTRILAVPLGYLSGWVPVGNTGGANVSPIKPMPIPEDLKPCFEGYSLTREIGIRVVVLSTAVAIGWLVAG
ncbi:MAG: DUF3703 domain-containing protein [Burkholderiaceae bacterium]